MLRRYFAILFLTIAQIIILGHGVVSHHHHNDDAKQGHNYHDKDSKHQHPNETPLELALSSFIHAGEHVSFTNSSETRIVITKDDVKSNKALPIDFIAPVEYILVYQKHTFPPDRYIIYSPPLHGAYTLRGPPTFIVA
ncbi:hypothetical protein CMT34_17160 [Elizabethkingia anophelis]|jgi:hypothetical protein|nr:hypothetical protein [Elizabethkingia anophelis]|tara:strand:- start:1440 stop:1853 length:414 start_codon:yes stop_codon:yes gene_type:complete